MISYNLRCNCLFPMDNYRVNLLYFFSMADPVVTKMRCVAREMMKILCDYRLPINLSWISDNGREFNNSLMSLITRSLGVKHVFSTPYHARCNGSAENSVKTIVATFRKLLGNDTHRWDEMLPAAQLCCNYKIRNRTASAPFSLMFAR